MLHRTFFTIKHWAPLAAATCLAFGLAAPGYAFSLLGGQSSLLAESSPAANSPIALAANDEFLPAHEAFHFSYSLGDNQLELRWDIADHYYLYQERFAFNQGSQAKLTPFYSPAELKFDELFGRETLVHYNLAKVRIPLDKDQPTQAITLSYQGCADAGLCYPPQNQTLLVNLATRQVSAQQPIAN